MSAAELVHAVGGDALEQAEVDIERGVRDRPVQDEFGDPQPPEPAGHVDEGVDRRQGPLLGEPVEEDPLDGHRVAPMGRERGVQGAELVADGRLGRPGPAVVPAPVVTQPWPNSAATSRARGPNAETTNGGLGRASGAGCRTTSCAE